MNDKFKGTGVAMASPMNEDLSLDFEGLSRLMDHVIKGGVNYLVLLGTTGESPTINWKDQLRLLDFCIDKLNGSIPLVFGLGGNNTSDLLNKLDEIKDRKIDAILSASPSYSKPSQEGIFAHYTALAIQSNFPIILYNVPHRTASNIEARTTLQLAEHPNIIGIKEASGDLNQCSDISKNRPIDFLLISGDDGLTLPVISLGGDGAISVLANAYPEPFCKMVNAARSNDLREATRIHQKLLPLFALAGKEGNPTSIKAALASMNISKTSVRLPLVAASSELVEEFRNSNF